MHKGDLCFMPPKVLSVNSTSSSPEYLYDGPFQCYGPQCTFDPNTYDSFSTAARATIQAPKKCRRYAADGITEVQRLERNSRAEKMATVDPNKFIFARVVRKTSAITGEEETSGYIPGLAQMQTCKIHVDGLVDADGRALCGNINYGPKEANEIPIKEPDCTFPELMNVTKMMGNTLDQMASGKVSTDAALLMPFVGSDAWGSCSFLVDQALNFEDVPQSITTLACGEEYSEQSDSAWQQDPCCNYALQNR